MSSIFGENLRGFRCRLKRQGNDLKNVTGEEWLDKLCHALKLLAAAADRYDGLMPSLLDVDEARMPQRLPLPIPGQREGDRSFPGSNLMHDAATLDTMFGLAQALNKPDLAAAADRYLHRFAMHCTHTPSGLFPWGEHSFWNLVEDRAGNSYVYARNANEITHDHLLQAPRWLWQKLAAIRPQCVESFAEGLDNHWRQGEPDEYNRHASMMRQERGAERGARSYDFPRHSGFYIFDWAFAFEQTGRADFLDQIARMLDYWWQCRDENSVLQTESRSPQGETQFYQINNAGQTFSLGVSLLEAAAMLHAAMLHAAPSWAQRLRERGAAYIEGFLSAPHDEEAGRLAILFCFG